MTDKKHCKTCDGEGSVLIRNKELNIFEKFICPDCSGISDELRESIRKRMNVSKK